MSQGAMIAGVAMVAICCSVSSAAYVMMGGDEEKTTTTTPTGPTGPGPTGPGGVGPHYRKYSSKKPTASCQANGEWAILDNNYFNRKLNCADTDCLDDGSFNFCFKRESENICNGSASGYYGRTPEERQLMTDGGRGDRVKDCVWVPTLPPNKTFNTEVDYINAAS